MGALGSSGPNPPRLPGRASTRAMGASTTDPKESSSPCLCTSFSYSCVVQFCLLPYGLFQWLSHNHGSSWSFPALAWDMFASLILAVIQQHLWEPQLLSINFAVWFWTCCLLFALHKTREGLRPHKWWCSLAKLPEFPCTDTFVLDECWGAGSFPLKTGETNICVGFNWILITYHP